MRIDALPTIVEDKLGLDKTTIIARHGINAVTRRVQKTNDAKSLVRNSKTKEDSSRHGKSNPYAWKPLDTMQ